MRNIDEENNRNDQIKQARINRKADQSRELKMPNEYSVIHEKTLRKIATKGGTVLRIQYCTV